MLSPMYTQSHVLEGRRGGASVSDGHVARYLFLLMMERVVPVLISMVTGALFRSSSTDIGYAVADLFVYIGYCGCSLASSSATVCVGLALVANCRFAF